MEDLQKEEPTSLSKDDLSYYQNVRNKLNEPKNQNNKKKLISSLKESDHT